MISYILQAAPMPTNSGLSIYEILIILGVIISFPEYMMQMSLSDYTQLFNFNTFSTVGDLKSVLSSL